MKKLLQIIAVVIVVGATAVSCSEEQVAPETGGMGHTEDLENTEGGWDD